MITRQSSVTASDSIRRVDSNPSAPLMNGPATVGEGNQVKYVPAGRDPGAEIVSCRLEESWREDTMSHPDPYGPPNRSPIKVGEVWENPVTRERATILERPWDNPVGRATAELTARVGARVVGEHLHPALVEHFTVLEGELTVK